MISFGQYLIIGLASMIYLSGAAFLLMGRPFLRSRLPGFEMGQRRTIALKGRGETPYFYPILQEGGQATVASTGPSSSVNEGQAPTSHFERSLNRQPVEQRNTELVLLANPICLN